jgi:hypothetical protein
MGDIANYYLQHGSDNDDQRRGGWPTPPSRNLLIIGTLASLALTLWVFTNALRRADAAGWFAFAVVAAISVAFVASLFRRLRQTRLRDTRDVDKTKS